MWLERMDVAGAQAKHKQWDNTIVKLEHTIQVFGMKNEQSTFVILKELNLQHGKGRNSAFLCLAALSANVLILSSGICMHESSHSRSHAVLLSCYTHMLLSAGRSMSLLS